MKKVLTFLLAGMLFFSFTGCNNTVDDEDNDTTIDDNGTPGGDTDAYKDGTYDGEGDAWDHGTESATVVIEDGKIKTVALRRLDTEGKEVNYDIFNGTETDGKLYPNLKEYKDTYADEMVEQQTYDIDVITGATISTQNWKVAVQRALEKAKDE